jgi:ATP-binding cassette subfamily F protein 3
VLLNVSNVKKGFAGDIVLEGVSFRMEAGEKVALVGRNGAGKSTLLKILTGQYLPDGGAVNIARGVKIGYLRQEAPVGEGRTVLEEAQEAIQEQMKVRRRMDELEHILEGGLASAEDLEEYTLLHEHFMEVEGYTLENDLKTVLARMGFSEEEFSKPTEKLSGGEKTRLAVAKLLLEEPELLILDEPTNHLDLQASEWLEGWIRQYRGAVLLVSHDRTFLTNTAERVIEMTNGAVKSYPGNFEKFLKLRAAEVERQAEVAKRQSQDIAKMDEFVRRFMNSQRTAQARGRQKLMNRLIENRVQAPSKERGLKGGFAEAKRSSDLVAETEKLEVGFGTTRLFPPLTWSVVYGDRWGVIGENGAGKSTLIKVLLGLIDSLGGKSRIGTGVITGYFSQDTADLDLEISPMDMMIYELDMKPPEARALLARYLITGDDVYRPIHTLSGGEKNKLALARLTHLNPNLLILDEPTNHLDMDSREALAEIVRDFKGTLILISHDRWLLGQVTDHTLDVRLKGAQIYNGSYDEYRLRSGNRGQKKTGSIKPDPIKIAEEPQRVEPQLSPRELSKEIQRLERGVEIAEEKVAACENDLKSLEDQLANLPATADVFSLTRDHQRMTEELQGSLSAWEEQVERLEHLRNQQKSSALEYSAS